MIQLHFKKVNSSTGLFVSAATLLASLSAVGEELPNVFDASVASSVYSQGSTRIPGLVWDGESEEPSFKLEGMKNGKPAARVDGKFESKNAGTLLFSSTVIQRAQFKNDSSEFSVLIPLHDRQTPVEVKYIDDYGNLKTQTFQIVYENFYQFQLDRDATKKRLNFDVGISGSLLDFKQSTPIAEVKTSQIGITPKFGITYNLTKNLDLSASTFITAVGLPLSRAPDGLSTPRFYGVNLRIGYKLVNFTRGNIYVMTGPYFWGMIIPPSPNGIDYGVVKLTGPQLFLVGRYLTSSGRTAVGYIKGASIIDEQGLTLGNREIAIGGAYQITPVQSKRRLMANLDFANAKFIVNGESIQLNSVSLGISTTF